MVIDWKLQATNENYYIGKLYLGAIYLADPSST